MIEASRKSQPLAALAIAPLLLLLGVAAWFVSDRLVIIGPFDRAQIGWAVVVPLRAMAPGAAAIAGKRTANPGLARLVIAGISIATAAFAMVGLATTITFVDCRPVSGPLEVLPRTILTALALGLGFAVSAAMAWRPAQQGRTVRALLTGGGVWIVAAAVALVIFYASFPALSCAAPPA